MTACPNPAERGMRIKIAAGSDPASRHGAARGSKKPSHGRITALTSPSRQVQAEAKLGRGKLGQEDVRGNSGSPNFGGYLVVSTACFAIGDDGPDHDGSNGLEWAPRTAARRGCPRAALLGQ